MILFYNEQEHVGGGQTVVDGYKKFLKKNHVQYAYVVGPAGASLFWNLFRNTYDRVFLHVYTERSVWIALICWIKRISLIVPVYGIWYLEWPDKSWRRKTWLYICQAVYMYSASTLVAFSAFAKKGIVSKFPFVDKKISIIPVGIDVHRYFPVTKKEKMILRKKLGMPPDAAACLMVTRLDQRKRVDIAIRAFERVAEKIPNSMLYVVFPAGAFNDYGLFASLAQLVSSLRFGNKIHFITGVDNQALPSYFQASDVSVSSALDFEHFGITILESMASGCAPVCFNASALPELVNQVDSSLVASPLHSDVLAKTIIRVLELSSKKRQLLVGKCRKIALSYSWEKIHHMISRLLVT